MRRFESCWGTAGALGALCSGIHAFTGIYLAENRPVAVVGELAQPLDRPPAATLIIDAGLPRTR